jgi:hypothetical protein
MGIEFRPTTDKRSARPMVRFRLQANRDDWIRTSGPFVPNEVRWHYSPCYNGFSAAFLKLASLKNTGFYKKPRRYQYRRGQIFSEVCVLCRVASGVEFRAASALLPPGGRLGCFCR